MVEIYERGGESVISICKRTKKSEHMHFMDVRETSKFSSLVIYSHQKNEHLKKIKECITVLNQVCQRGTFCQ